MTAKPVGLQWVRTPHQDRSRRTLERLLDTSEALLQERGFENVSVAEIAHAAGSSVGAFYARFRDKNGLLHHLHERFCEEAAATIDAATDPLRWEGAGPAEIIAELVRFLDQDIRSRSGMLRAFLLVAQNDARFQERDRILSEHVTSRLTELLLRHRNEYRHPDPAFAVAFGMELVMGVLRSRYVLGTHKQGTQRTPANGIVPELVRAYCGYLGVACKNAAETPAAAVTGR